MHTLLKTKEGLLLSSALLLILITITISFLFLSPQTREPRSPSPTPTISTKAKAAYGQYPQIRSISPSEFTRLPAGEKQTFLIQFRSAVKGDGLRVELTQHPITATEVKTFVAFSKTYNERTKTLSVTTSGPLEAQSEYDLVIKDANKTLLLAKFSTREIEPTPVRTNNQALRVFLPHVAYNYRLEYNERLGVYIFEFRIDPYSSFDLNTQYSIAKKDAEDFIKEHGVSLESLTIIWKGSQ